jgi:hypothetical protein
MIPDDMFCKEAIHPQFKPQDQNTSAKGLFPWVVGSWGGQAESGDP